MKSIVLSAALLFGAAVGLPAVAHAQSMGQDMKDLGHDSKNAAKKGTEDTKKGVTKSTHAVKKGTTKSTRAVKNGVHEGADKVDQKTADTNPK